MRWAMFVRVLIVVGALAWAQQAAAQPLFDNPFAEATAYRSERETPSEARYRLRYEATRVERGGAPEVSELVIDVAPDWSLTREGDVVVLRDFRLNRVFALGDGVFTTMNGLADLTFRIMERQNRSYLQRMLAAAGAQGELPDACDAEAELGLAIPGASDAGATEIRESRGVFTLRCGNREIGSFTPSDGGAPPAAFWPTMYAAMVTHPALHHRVAESSAAPAQLDISFREGTGGLSRRSWRLVSVEQVAVPYPLEAGLRNATAGVLDQLVPGAGQIGADAVAGRAQGGAPTLQSWDQHLRAVSQSEGEAAAAMLLNATFNMFPEMQCANGERLFACDLVRRVRTLEDPAPWAVIEVGAMEQQGNNPAAIAAMQRAQTSPQRDHPALGASFALAVLRFNQEELSQARAANLPTDIAALQDRALLAFAYNPAYWTDVGDRFGRDYEWPGAFMFYDVAYSLPLPSAIARNQALVQKRAQMERIRRDFPDASLPATP